MLTMSPWNGTTSSTKSSRNSLVALFLAWIFLLPIFLLSNISYAYIPDKPGVGWSKIRPPAAQTPRISTQLHVLTYNIWGLPFPAQHATWRYPEIAKRLQNFDIIAIQEAWAEDTDPVLTINSHPYRAFGTPVHGIWGGSGIAILSKYPILESEFRPFHDCSYWECPAKKGILYARIEIKKGIEVDVYTSHFNASADEDFIRTSQVMDFIGLVHDHSNTNPIILLGDFNATYQDINYGELTGNLTVKDSYFEYVQRLKNPTEQVRKGYTYDLEHNPWATNSAQSERVDYIFFRDTYQHQFRILNSSVAFTELVREEKPLSDHYGVSTLFEILSKTQTK